MKRDHQPVAPRSTALTPGTTPSASKPNTLEKLELELDDQATHVHRIPKELINRMREREQARDQAKKEEDSVPPSHEQDFPADDDDGFSSMATVSDDRTAVFRPPPELLARAKRMRAPAKPNRVSEAPTKPPPAPAADDAEARAAAPAIPAAPMMPVMAPISTSPAARPTPMTPAAPRPTPLAPKGPLAGRPALSAPAARPAAPAPAPSNDAVSIGRVVPVAPVMAAESPAPRELDASHADAESPARASLPSSSGTSEVSSLIPLLTDPAESPAFEAPSHTTPDSAPRSEVPPSSAEIATAFSADASGDAAAPSSSVARAPLVSEAPPGAGSSLARWLVAILVAAAFGMSLISWLRR